MTNTYITNTDQLFEKIWETVHKTPAIDAQTFLFDSRFPENFQITGIDSLLATRPLTNELFRFSPRSLINPEKPLDKDEFETMPLRMQAEVVWHRLFLANTPLSEATRGVLTTLGLLGLNPQSRNLGAYRTHFANTPKQQQIENIFKKSNLESIVCCYNPLDEIIRKSWETNSTKKYYTALDLTELAGNWSKIYPQISKLGYAVKKGLDKNVYPKIKSFLRYVIEKSSTAYLLLNLFSGTTLANKKNTAIKILQKCLIPLAIELNFPLAINFTTEREELTFSKLKLTEKLQLSNIDLIRELLTKNPELKILVSDENYNNQNAFIRLAKEHSKLMLLGYTNIFYTENSFVETTTQRIAELGTSFISNHSNATVYDELLYKWAYTRWGLALALQNKFSSLYRTGWRVTEYELTREIRNILIDNFKNFTGI